MIDEDIRLPLLQRLAEQAMSDPDFRAVARDDLDRALIEHGYELNGRERALVFRFRDALEEAGVDLFLTPELNLDFDRELTPESANRLERLLKERGR